MFLLIAIAFLLQRDETQAVPLPALPLTSSTFHTSIFTRDDHSDGCHTRTVLDILWSCLATTFACTWVSVHPNVPFKGEGKWTLLRRRIFLMFFSILAPEFMIMWAFKQWRGAVMIREVINKALKNSSPNTVKPPWSTVHGHFLQMGGFKINITEDEYEYSEAYMDLKHSDQFLEGVVTFNAIQNLLDEGLIHFPTITEDEINDRSEGDALSKGIAFFQLAWFIVQIITRLAQDVAITELELTTAALAGLNSVMYIFWWSKPRDVHCPVVIRTKGVERLLATMDEDITWSFPQREFDFRRHLLTSLSASMKKALNTLRTFLVSSPRSIKDALSKFISATRVLPRHLHYYLSQIYQYSVRIFGDLMGGKRVEPKRASEKESSDVPVAVDPVPLSHMQKIYVNIRIGEETTVYCFAFLFSLPAYVINFGLFVPIAQILHNDAEYGKRLPVVFDSDEQVRIFSMIFYSENADISPLLSTASIAGVLFGGVHSLAWHFSFPSHAEQIMWRAASLGIAGACALWLVGTHTWKYIDDIDEHDNIGEIYSFPRFVLRIVLLLLTTLVYSVARLLLLVLAVTSLRSLPPSAFDTVHWIELVPHI